MNTNSNDPVGPYRDPSIPPASGRCHLFTLPLELREYIYNYALSDEERLESYVDEESRIRFRGTTTYPDDYEYSGLQVEFTQLRYVNKQLHAETRSLMFGLNDIRFNGSPKTSGTVIARLFLSKGTAKVKASLRKLVIHHNVLRDDDDGYDEEPSDQLRNVLNVQHNLQPSSFFHQFCTQHPKACIILRFPYMDNRTSPWAWIRFHYASQHAVRGQSEMPVTKTFYNRARGYTIKNVGSNIPPNLRFTLSEDFWVTVKKLQSIPDRDGTSGSTKLVEQARKVFKEGI